MSAHLDFVQTVVEHCSVKGCATAFACVPNELKAILAVEFGLGLGSWDGFQNSVPFECTVLGPKRGINS